MKIKKETTGKTRIIMTRALAETIATDFDSARVEPAADGINYRVIVPTPEGEVEILHQCDAYELMDRFFPRESKCTSRRAVLEAFLTTSFVIAKCSEEEIIELIEVATNKRVLAGGDLFSTLTTDDLSKVLITWNNK